MNTLTRALIAYSLGVGLLGNQSHAITQYHVTDIGTLGGSRSWAFAINNNGQVVGSSTTADGKSHAFIYNASQGMQDLGTLGGTTSYASAINDLGQVVGNSTTANGSSRGFIWESSKPMRDLGTLGGASSYAGDINNDGLIAGSSNVSGGTELHGFTWSANGQMLDLGAQFEINAVNNSGLLVGSGPGANGDPTHPAYYRGSGPMQDIGTLGGTGGHAWGVNGLDWIVGDARTSDGDAHAFVYVPGLGMQDLGTLGGTSSIAQEVNDLGQIVGSSSTVGGRGHAFLYDDGIMVDLNACIDPLSGWELMGAEAINSSGQIVGVGTYNRQSRAFLLTPIPEPATLIFLTIALGLFSRRASQAAT